MKTKMFALAAGLIAALLLPGSAFGQLTLTGARLFGLDANGHRQGSEWDTVGNNGDYNIYFFTGSPRSPQFLNAGNTDDSLNPKFALRPGTYTLGLAADTMPCSRLELELCFNNDPHTRISVQAQGGAANFSGTTTFSTGGMTVTLTQFQVLSQETDLVGADATKPDGTPDTTGQFTLVVTQAQPPPAEVTLSDFQLTGDLRSDQAAFTLTGNAVVTDAKGGDLELVSGQVALTSIDPRQKWRMAADGSGFRAHFERRGRYPIEVHFNAAVTRSNDWRAVNFSVARSALQPVVLAGLAADTEFQFASAARPERAGSNFVSYLPEDGAVNFAWKTARPETEGKLFYAADMLAQISVSPDLMRQTAQLNGKIMQGEMSRLALKLHGAGEVTRVQGDGVLAWNVVPGTNAGDAELIVQFNQPQKDAFALVVQMQTPLGAFPQTAEALRLQPENATRLAGSLRIVNEGAVRLEVLAASGLSQISPDQFPEGNLFSAKGSQRFAYRFSSADYALRIAADQILPEVGVSEVLTYNLGDSELAVDAEIELDIREAPLRELILHVPKGYAVAKLAASGLSDYFTGETPDHSGAELRLVYGQPISDRQVVQLRLEHNQSPGETNWTLPRVEVAQAKSVRGFVGVSADSGYRLTPERTQALTEIATAYFPQPPAGIQSAFRLSEPDWQATMRVERLPQTVQADVFHLFSIGEGIAYGSSVINYVVSGAPVAAFQVALADDYLNVEFTGKDIRNWEKTTSGWRVQLHTPVAGAYTLLATYERPFKPQGETLAFPGARALDAQSESGHTIIISAYQFQVTPVEVSPGLVALEPGEVPPEYRLFFDQPVLKAYRYAGRPFALKLALSPLAQGVSLPQVVDRASLTTHISKEGQAITEAQYFVKSRGTPNFRVTLPEKTELWSATVDDQPVVPVTDGLATLIPLPRHADPDTVLKINLQLAAKARDAGRVELATPKAGAPMMLAEWQVLPDEGQRLQFLSGTLPPVNETPDTSGFAQITQAGRGFGANVFFTSLALAFVFLFLALVLWRWATMKGVYRRSGRHVLGGIAGVLALLIAAIAFLRGAAAVETLAAGAPDSLTFRAPVQQADNALTVQVANLSTRQAAPHAVVRAWPALLTVALWLLARNRDKGTAKAALNLLGWTALAWAALRLPNGAPLCLGVLAAFLLLRVVSPALRQLWRLPAKPDGTDPDLPPPQADVPPVTALLAGLLLLGGALHGRAGTPELVEQQLRVDNGFASGTAKIHWQAEKNEVLELLDKPAVLTHVEYPKTLRLETLPEDARSAQQLVAQKDGAFDIELQYQLPVTKLNNDSGFTLPVPGGLVNHATLALVNLDVDVFSPQAVSVQRSSAGSNTVAALVLTPGSTWVGWKPRSRRVENEKAVFYAELSQLYVPAAGVVEGVHKVAIRPAQGAVGQLTFNVPAGATITDVIDRRTLGSRDKTSRVSLWRFDPDARKLTVTLNPSVSQPFALFIRSQAATGPLPFAQRVGLLAVEGAASQIGLLGVATDNEVQLDDVSADQLSPINLEDFPTEVADQLAAQFPGLTVRRAFRYAETQATATLKASAVEPDVRVETQSTLSLGEDRTVLATTADVAITRAGIFKLTFLLPAGYDVESISGGALSHWTELKTDAGRVITLNLTGKTDGQQQFIIGLSGPGVKTASNWTVPQVSFREAGKQRGTLLVVPEQGMRLEATTREGVTQLDPQQSGVRQKGVLAFRVLETPWNLALDIEQVDPWIQVTSLQHAALNEAQIKVTANLQYQIENTGLKAFRVYIPTNAEGVTFSGDQLADFLAADGETTNGLQAWDVKLHRRVIGQYLLQVNYQIPITSQPGETILRGVLAADVNLQRGFATVESSGRLQVRVDNLPASLQPTEWQAIPRVLQKDLPAASANFAYRLVEPDFQLPLKLERHEATKLLAAHVNDVTFTSVISDAGVMLTQARLDILPGDLRLLKLALPAGAKYWFAFVDQNGVWPWREGDDILIPLAQTSHSDQPVPVEIYFSCSAGQPAGDALDLNLLAPKFELPLENLTWRVFLNDQWQVKKWTGALQLQQQEVVPSVPLDMAGYLQTESSWQQEKTKQAEDMLAAGNTALQNGEPQQARRAFESAYDLSTHDQAFNEDARVQLNNLKLQQALMGLNVRQASAAGETTAAGGKLNELRNNKDGNYTQQDAQQIIDNNSADENTALMKLASRLIQQQDAAVANPAVIRANIPEQGQLLTFKRAVVVDTWADLNIGLDVRTTKGVSWGSRAAVLALVALVLAGFTLLAGWLVKTQRG